MPETEPSWYSHKAVLTPLPGSAFEAKGQTSSLWGPEIEGADQVSPGLYVGKESESVFSIPKFTTTAPQDRIPRYRKHLAILIAIGFALAQIAWLVIDCLPL